MATKNFELNMKQFLQINLRHLHSSISKPSEICNWTIKSLGVKVESFFRIAKTIDIGTHATHEYNDI
jgi:hypothetical protein